MSGPCMVCVVRVPSAEHMSPDEIARVGAVCAIAAILTDDRRLQTVDDLCPEHAAHVAQLVLKIASLAGRS